jgi:hypothetical protein
VKGGRSRCQPIRTRMAKTARITVHGKSGGGPRLAAEVVRATMGEQQQAPGAKDLWVEAAHGWEDSGGSGALTPQLPRKTAVPERDRGRSSTTARGEGEGQPWDVLVGKGGVRAVWPPPHGNTPLTGLHLSPAGGKPHGRWEGGGQETGESVMDSGNERLGWKHQGCAPELYHAVAPRLPATRSGQEVTRAGRDSSRQRERERQHDDGFFIL